MICAGRGGVVLEASPRASRKASLSTSPRLHRGSRVAGGDAALHGGPRPGTRGIITRRGPEAVPWRPVASEHRREPLLQPTRTHGVVVAFRLRLSLGRDRKDAPRPHGTPFGEPRGLAAARAPRRLAGAPRQPPVLTSPPASPRTRAPHRHPTMPRCLASRGRRTSRLATASSRSPRRRPRGCPHHQKCFAPRPPPRRSSRSRKQRRRFPDYCAAAANAPSPRAGLHERLSPAAASRRRRGRPMPSLAIGVDLFCYDLDAGPAHGGQPGNHPARRRPRSRAGPGS